MEVVEVLLKFGKEKYMKNLLSDGSIRLNTLDLFKEHDDEQIGDKNEGLIRQYIGDGLVNGKHKATDISVSAKLLNHNLYCLYAIKRSEAISNLINDTYMLNLKGFSSEDWTHCVVINYSKFKKRLLNKLSQGGYTVKNGLVKYCDLSNKTSDFDPFVKDIQYKPQNEYRFLVEHPDNIAEPIDIKIGSIADFASIIPMQGNCIYIPYKIDRETDK